MEIVPLFVEGSDYFMLPSGYKQSGGKENVKAEANASRGASHNKKWATA